MGVYEADIRPWIPMQIDKLAARLDRDRPTLGVCLGRAMIGEWLTDVRA